MDEDMGECVCRVVGRSLSGAVLLLLWLTTKTYSTSVTGRASRVQVIENYFLEMDIDVGVKEGVKKGNQIWYSRVIDNVEDEVLG